MNKAVRLPYVLILTLITVIAVVPSSASASGTVHIGDLSVVNGIPSCSVYDGGELVVEGVLGKDSEGNDVLWIELPCTTIDMTFHEDREPHETYIWEMWMKFYKDDAMMTEDTTKRRSLSGNIDRDKAAHIYIKHYTQWTENDAGDWWYKGYSKGETSDRTGTGVLTVVVSLPEPPQPPRVYPDPDNRVRLEPAIPDDVYIDAPDPNEVYIDTTDPNTVVITSPYQAADVEFDGDECIVTLT